MKYKILQLDLPVILVKLLYDFLDDRPARVRLGTYLGESFDLTCGVPEGSVLSSTLFTLYTRLHPTTQRRKHPFCRRCDTNTRLSRKSKNMAQLATVRAIVTKHLRILLENENQHQQIRHPESRVKT